MKSLQRDLKKVNVELEQILKKDSHIKNEKKKAQEKNNGKKDESDTGDKNKVEGLVKKWFSSRKMKGKLENKSITNSLYKINKFRQQSQAIQALQQQQAQILALFLQRR